MRLHMNPTLVSAKARLAVLAANVSRERQMIDDPAHPADPEYIREQQNKLDVARADFVALPAHNGLELLVQLETMLDRTDEWMSNGGAFEQALTATARPQPSAAMAAAFSAFRESWIAVADNDVSTTHTTDDECRLVDAMTAALASIFTVSCATPGDFLVKSYANLLWHAGHTASRHLPDHDTGSYFDVALSEIDSDSIGTDAYYRSVYEDLDHSDLGACLLATGNIDFDPFGWVERAATIGMPVSVVIRSDETKSLNFGFIDSDNDRLRREERRLQQILTFDHRSRWRQVADFITDRRPDLVFDAPAKGAS